MSLLQEKELYYEDLKRNLSERVKSKEQEIDKVKGTLNGNFINYFVEAIEKHEAIQRTHVKSE